jgi:hypothetical protein
MHGGKTPTGLAAPQLRHGNNSLYINSLGPRMLDRLMTVQANEDLLTLEPHIYVVMARIEEMVARAEEGEAYKALKDALAAFEEFAEAQIGKNRAASLDALERLSSVLRRGVAEYEAWEHVKDWQKHLKSLVESERKRYVEHREMVQVAIVFRLIQLCAASVKRNVTDTAALQAISDDITRYAGSALIGANQTGIFDSPAD